MWHLIEIERSGVVSQNRRYYLDLVATRSISSVRLLHSPPRLALAQQHVPALIAEHSQLHLRQPPVCRRSHAVVHGHVVVLRPCEAPPERGIIMACLLLRDHHDLGHHGQEARQHRRHLGGSGEEAAVRAVVGFLSCSALLLSLTCRSHCYLREFTFYRCQPVLESVQSPFHKPNKKTERLCYLPNTK
jgi:hypothetical protein